MRYFEKLQDRRLGIGWLDIFDRVNDDFIKSVTQNLTSYWVGESSVFWQIPNSYGPSVDVLLNDAADTDLKWLIICAPGLTFVRDGNFFQILSTMIDGLSNTALMGHVLDTGDQYYQLHHQTLLVNLDWYRTHNRPEFGKTDDLAWETIEPLRSEESFHDGYTPIWVKNGNTSRNYTGKKPGWNLIKSALESGYDVKPFNKDLRLSKYYYYPDVEGDWPTKLGPMSYDLQTTVHFVSNTESVIYVPDEHVGTFDICMFPAGGINAILIPWMLRMKTNTTVMINDISPLALDMAGKLVANYRGGSLNEFLNNSYIWPRDSQFFRGFYRASDLNEISAMQEIIDAEMKNGLGEWIDTVMPTLTYHFNCANVFDENDWWAFSQGVHSKRKVYVNLSNIWHYLPTTMIFSLKNRMKMHDKMMTRLSQLDADIQLHYVHPTLKNMMYVAPIDALAVPINHKFKVLPWNN